MNAGLCYIGFVGSFVGMVGWSCVASVVGRDFVALRVGYLCWCFLFVAVICLLLSSAVALLFVVDCVPVGVGWWWVRILYGTCKLGLVDL